MNGVDRELRDWMRGLAVAATGPGRELTMSWSAAVGPTTSGRMATDGTLKAALNEIAAAETELAG